MQLTELIPSPVKAQDVPKVINAEVKPEAGPSGKAGLRDRHAQTFGSNYNVQIYAPDGAKLEPLSLPVTAIDPEESFHQTRKHQFKWAWTTGKERYETVNGRQIRRSPASDPNGMLVVLITPEGADVEKLNVTFA